MTRCERFSPSPDFAIFVIKPDGLTRIISDYPLIDLIRGLFDSAKLKIAFEAEKKLTEEGVRKIYKILDQPSEYGESWKNAVVNHMCSRPVYWFLLCGDDAQKKAKLIKDFLRSSLTNRENERGKIVENIVHVVDQNDFRDSIDVLFDTI